MARALVPSTLYRGMDRCLADCLGRGHDGRAASAATPAGNAWSIDAWLASLDLHQAAATALAQPSGQDAFSYAKTRLKGEVESKLGAAKLEGLLPYIMEGITALQAQEVATAS